MGDCTASTSASSGTFDCLRIVRDRALAERRVAGQIRTLIDTGREIGRPAVLGLATGRSMIGVLAECVRLFREEDLSFEGVRTFNLDEYIGLDVNHDASFHAFMQVHLFAPVGLDKAHAHVPSSKRALINPDGYADIWEAAIEEAGGLDVQLLGLGENAHIAFNEPGSSRESRTRIVDLAEDTRQVAAAQFCGLEYVPRQAFTAGIATIRAAKRLRILAFGARKAPALKATLMGPVDEAVPASLIRDHPDLEIWIDEAAASELDPERVPDGAWVR